MKRIYNTLFIVGFISLFMSSCNDWLDVRPSDEIKEEYLFETGNGYRTALNGIYRKLATFDLYGSNLSWGLIDGWGLVYNLDKAPDDGGGRAMKKIATFSFKHSELTPTTDAMWDAAWNIIANCNNLAQQVENEDTLLFYDRTHERDMIFAEAIALRAYMHFDLLRIYAPSLLMNPGERTFIPYVDKYPSYLSDRQTVSYCLQHIIDDLKKAQSILLSVDKSASFSMESRFIQSYNGESRFLGYRGYRMNYYAVTAELARVYLYAQKADEAYAEAKKVIDVVESKKWFAASTSSSGFNKGNMKMMEDIIFSLYSTDLTDWDQKINHLSDNPADEYNEHYLFLGDELVNEFFGSEKSSDWRLIYQLEGKYYDYYYRTLKYNKQKEGTTYSKVNDEMIPMIRMSEVYYIAAEAIYKTDPALAQKYLSSVKKGRGIKNVDYSQVTSEEEFINMIVSDARREFVGEGQTFFMYKRLKKNLLGMEGYSWKEVEAKEENMVLPLPDSESNI